MSTIKTTLMAAALASLPLHASFAHEVSAGNDAAPSTKVTLVYDQPLPGLPNKSLKGVLVEYPPGGTNPPHTHAESALIYATVLEGAVLNQLNGGPLRTYTRGQNFTEFPGDRHDVSANASKTEPATLLAVFVVDTDDKALTTPLPKP